jgi:ABC-type nitrate/sulfonate/bicarbonate transport system permease component
MNSSLPRRARYGLGGLGLSLTAGAWLALSWNSADTFFPPLRDMVPAAIEFWSSPEGLLGVRETLGNLLWGLSIGIVTGAVLGLIVGQVAVLELALSPIFEFVRSIPKPALLPVAIAIFGIGAEMRIFSIAFGVTWLILINTIDGLKNLPPQWLDTARVYGLTVLQRQSCVVVPAIAPRIMSGVHIAIPASLILSVTSEIIGGNSGIGAVIYDAQYTYKIELMWSGVLLLGVIGWLLSGAYNLTERALSLWSPGPGEVL